MVIRICRSRSYLFIPDELMSQVLKELPVKSLLRFRCVCKRWLSIIDDPHFVSLHRERSHSRAGGVNFVIKTHRRPTPILYNPVTSEINVNPFPHKEEYHISDGDSWGCAEGLFLDCNQIWNLSTGKRIHYPPVPLSSNREAGILTLNLYFLGFDPQSNQYKLVCFSVVRRERYIWRGDIQCETKYVANILTLGTNSWRSLDVNVLLHPHHPIWISYPGKTSCCINGVLYIYKEIVGPLASPLIAFEVRSEKFYLVPLPCGISEDTFLGYCRLCHDFRGKFVLFSSIYPEFRWILKDVKSGRWKGTCEFDEMYVDLSRIFYTHMCNLPEIPQLKPLLECQSYLSCPTVESLFQIKPNFELNSNHN